MKPAVCFFLSLISSWALAATETTTSSASLSGVSPDTVEASSKAQALQTQAIYYSLPRKEMTYLELGALTQAQDFRVSSDTTRLDNQAFFFNHSRGLTDQFAIDFGVNYFLRDNKATYGSNGIGQASVGGRSHFEAMDLNWVYGAFLTYLPDGQYSNTEEKFAGTAKIGFEEAVDIAKWGLDFQLTSQNTRFFDEQANLIGFFEIPFASRLNVGISGGADLARLQRVGTDHNHFARAYGQFAIDKVSAVQANLKQSNQRDDDNSLSETEFGVSLNRVF